jgi:hypothetical protein
MNSAVLDLRDKLDIDLFPELRDLPDSYLSYIIDGSEQGERLEYIGDSVLDLIVADMLFDDFNVLTPGEMTALRSEATKNLTLAYLLIKKKLCTVRNKKCADKLEVLIGVIYEFTGKNISLVEKYLNQVFGLYSIIEELISFDTKNVDDIIDDNVPIYGKWNGKCDKGTRTSTRPCLSGKCEKKDLTNVNTCETSWSSCSNGYMTKYLKTGEKEVKLCHTSYGKCDKNGQRTVKNALGEYENETCPDDLYGTDNVVDSTCKDGKVRVYRKCLDPNLCEDILWDTYPCDNMVPTIEEFSNLDHEEQWRIYEKLKDKYNFAPKSTSWDVEEAYSHLLKHIYN